MNEVINGLKATGRDALKGSKVLNITLSDIWSVLLCYIMSACNLMEGRTPLVLSAYASVFTPGRWIIPFVFSLAGIIRFRFGQDAVFYIMILLSSTIVMGFLGHVSQRKAVSVTFFLALFSIVRNIINAADMYDYFLSGAECLVCFFGTYVFTKGLPLLIKGTERRYVLNSEIISVYVLMACMIRCTVRLPLVMGMDVSVVLSVLLLLVINMGGDITSSCAMGILLGFVTRGGADGTLASVGAFAFASLCAGILNSFGKWGVALGFVFANSILSAFFRAGGIPYDIFEVITAIIIFSFLPSAAMEYVSSLPRKTVHTATKIFVEQEKIQSVISSRLKTAAVSYANLGMCYNKCFEEFPSGNYIIHMLDTASSKICPDCGLKYNCWERCLKESYKAMMKMLECAEKKGILEKKDVPQPFAGKCIKLTEFVDEFNRMYQLYKVEKIWRKRQNDTTILISSLLEALAVSVNNIENELSMCPDLPAEKELKARLDSRGSGICDITFLRGDNDFFIEIISDKNNFGKKESDICEKVIEDITNTKVVLWQSKLLERGVSLCYKKAGKFHVSTGNASVSSDGEKVSGDSYTICNCPDGKVIAAISDGMGTGKKAADESRTAIRLLENFVKSGIKVEAALELVNSSLVIRSSGDSFATMDVCIIDSESGHVSLYKYGAASGYVKNGDCVREISSECLPFGVMANGEKPKDYSFDTKDSAFVVLMSDGVSDVFADKKYITEKLKNISSDNPQIIASEIIGDAVNCLGGKPKDDMTVVVISIWENP